MIFQKVVFDILEREAKSRVKEKKPPKAAINLGTDVDAPWGEKIETSRKDNHQNA